MRLDELNGFLAMRPLRDDPAVRAIGNACVTGPDKYCTHMDEADRKVRLTDKLSNQQFRFLLRWGYPHVLSQFRFQMTLTERMKSGEVDRTYEVLKDYFRPALSAPLTIDSIFICGSPGGGRPFEFLCRSPCDKISQPNDWRVDTIFLITEEA